MSTRYGSLAVCRAGRLGIVTGSRTRPGPGDGHSTVWFGIQLRGMGRWESVDPRWLSPSEEEWLKDQIGLDTWEAK